MRVETPEEILDLVRLIRAGRVYSVEEWIRAGKPIQARSYRLEKRSVDSPLTAALESRRRSADGMVFDEDLGDSEEVRVGRDDREPVLHRAGRDPDVVRASRSRV